MKVIKRSGQEVEFDPLKIEKAIELVDVFLDTKFSEDERHIRRIAQITDLENRF